MIGDLRDDRRDREQGRHPGVVQLANGVDALRSGEPFRATGTDTLADVQTFEALYRRWLAV